jgi:hypothetical protein
MLLKLKIDFEYSVIEERYISNIGGYILIDEKILT